MRGRSRPVKLWPHTLAASTIKVGALPCRFQGMLHRVENAWGVFGSTETHSRGTSVPHLRLQLLEPLQHDDRVLIPRALRDDYEPGAIGEHSDDARAVDVHLVDLFVPVVVALILFDNYRQSRRTLLGDHLADIRRGRSDRDS